MAQETTPLTDEERSELEQLRAEKAAREQAAQAHHERVEHERTLMEPGDDLAMPVGQRIVLIAVAVAAILALAVIFFG